LVRKSKAVIKDFTSLTRIPDHAQKEDVTDRRRDIPAAEPVVRARSSAKPRHEVRSPVIVLCPMPVDLRASSSALKKRLKSSGESLSPCFIPLSRNIGADLP
jgi:hypothetical protein